jgi:hypothetical protein
MEENNNTELVPITEQSKFETFLNEAFKGETPSFLIDTRPDGYSYVDYQNMLAERNGKFPLHSDEWFGQGISFMGEFVIATVQSHVWVEVNGQSFKSTAIGCDAKRMTFKKDSPHVPANVVDLGNDVKSVMSDSLKKAWSNLGVAPNVYMTNVPTVEQNKRFQVEVLDILMSIPELKNMAAKTILAYKTQNINTADKFISKSVQRIKELQQKQNKE